MSKDQDPVWFWKNFRMGTELQISGSFIYNAIYCIDQMETFHNEEDCFEFLYNASVGLERLFKIAIILIEHDETENQEDFERSLITHSNSDLLARIKKKHQLQLGKSHNRFISLLDNFYNSTRYNRFNLSSVYIKNQDKYGLVEFLKLELGDQFPTYTKFATPVTQQSRKFLGKIIGKFATQLYQIIKEEAHRNRTFTYEISYSSKAFKIFMENKFDFTDERITQREALLHILKNGIDEKYKEYIDSIPSINLESFNTDKYIQSIFGYDLDGQVTQEIEYVYEEDKPNMDRIDKIMAIGSGIDFDDFDLEEGELENE